MKTIILPRQARDKRDGKVEKRDAFFAETLTAGPSDAAANRKLGVI
eukprot:COSAG06_NODE_29204_length_560_cov_1.817787_1_plen_46_part_00